MLRSVTSSIRVNALASQTDQDLRRVMQLVVSHLITIPIGIAKLVLARITLLRG
jgi:hypothetical protein